MSVYKPAKSPYWQYDFVYQKRRYYGSTQATTKAAARRVEEKKRLDAALGKLTARTIPTIDQASAEWFVFKGQNLASAEDVEARLAVACELIGKSRPVNEVTTAVLAEAIRKRRAILVRGKTVPANATVNRDIVDCIRPVIKRQRKLLNNGAGDLVAFPEIDWTELVLAEPESEPHDYSGAEMQAMYDALPLHWRDFAHFEARYGLRLGEMFFSVGAVNIQAQRVTTIRRRKNGKPHTVPLLSEDAAMLAARIGRAVAAGLDTPWFRELKGGRLKALTYWGAQKALGAAMRTSGLYESKGAKGSHDLRHHAGMQALRHSNNLQTVRKLLGHASIQSTMVYAHAMEGDVRAALEAVARNSHEPARDTETQTVAPQGKTG